MSSSAGDDHYQPPSWELLFRWVDKLADLTSENVALPDTALALHIAHATVSRNRELLCGAKELAKAGLGDTCGTLFRSVYENWLVGQYAVLGGPEAVDRLINLLPFQQKPILTALGKSAASYVKLTVREMSEKVTELIRQKGLPDAEFASRHYELGYSWDSYFDVHGGLAPLEGYLQRGKTDVVVSRSRAYDETFLRHRFLVAVAMLLSGVHSTFVESGMDCSELEQMAEDVNSFDTKGTKD